MIPIFLILLKPQLPRFVPSWWKWFIFLYLQLETNQPINHYVHLYGAESRISSHSVEPECSLPCLQDRSFLHISQFNIVLQCAPGISKWYLYFRFSGLHFVRIYLSHARYWASPVWLPSSSSYLARTTNYEDPFRCYLPPQIPVLENPQSVFVS